MNYLCGFVFNDRLERQVLCDIHFNLLPGPKSKGFSIELECVFCEIDKAKNENKDDRND